MTQVGTPNPKAITGVRLTFNTTGEEMFNCNIDNIIARQGTVYEATYDSAFCFVDPVTYAWKQFATGNSDLISLEEDTYQILMLETALVVMQEAFGASYHRGVSTDVDIVTKELTAAYTMYERNHKSQNDEPFQSVYIFGNMYDGYTDVPLDSDMWDGDRSNPNNTW